MCEDQQTPNPFVNDFNWIVSDSSLYRNDNRVVL